MHCPVSQTLLWWRLNLSSYLNAAPGFHAAQKHSMRPRNLDHHRPLHCHSSGDMLDNLSCHSRFLFFWIFSSCRYLSLTMGQILLTLYFRVSFTAVLWYQDQGLNFTDEETKVEKGKAHCPGMLKTLMIKMLSSRDFINYLKTLQGQIDHTGQLHLNFSQVFCAKPWPYVFFFLSHVSYICLLVPQLVMGFWKVIEPLIDRNCKPKNVTRSRCEDL